MQDTNSQSNYFPEKKPAGSVRSWSIEDVKAALRRRLILAEQEQDPEKRAEILQKAWPLVRTIRRHGWSSPWALAAASGMCAGLVLLAIATTPTVHTLGKPDFSIRVLRQFNAYDFELQKVYQGAPQTPSVWHFCRDFKPLIQVGFTLTELTWIDRDDCSEIAPKFIHHAYHVQRVNGWPTLPNNCVNSADKPVVCNGDPQF